LNNHSEIVSFIWSVADLIRDTFKRALISAAVTGKIDVRETI
jgi:hypothetical protein